MFTQQHYKAIAKIIRENTGLVLCQVTLPVISRTHRNVRYGIATNLADYFAKDNPNFDREKFLSACGL